MITIFQSRSPDMDNDSLEFN